MVAKMSETILVAGVEMTREEFGLGDPVAEYQERNRYICYRGTKFSRRVFLSLLGDSLTDKPYACSICGQVCGIPGCPDCKHGVYICTSCYRPTNRCFCDGQKGVDIQAAM